MSRCSKRAVASTPLRDVGWNSELSDAFLERIKAIAQGVTLAHQDNKKCFCAVTDANDSHWSAILTQVPIADFADTHADQLNNVLAFHFRLVSPIKVG